MSRSLLALELAVVLPATALIVAATLHLNRIQRDRSVEAAIQRDFNQVLAISEKHINAKAYDLVDDVASQVPAPGYACSVTLDKILAAHPYVAHIFVYDPENGLVFRSQPHRMEETQFRDESQDLIKMESAWMKVGFDEFSKELEHRQKKGMRYTFEANSAPRGEKRAYQSIAMYVPKYDEDGKKAMVGIVFDAEYLRNQFFPEMIEGVMNRSLAEAQGDMSHTVIMVHYKSDMTPIAASTGWDGGEPEVERNLEGAFPGLVLGMKVRGTTS